MSYSLYILYFRTLRFKNLYLCNLYIVLVFWNIENVLYAYIQKLKFSFLVW